MNKATFAELISDLLDAMKVFCLNYCVVIYYKLILKQCFFTAYIRSLLIHLKETWRNNFCIRMTQHLECLGKKIKIRFFFSPTALGKVVLDLMWHYNNLCPEGPDKSRSNSFPCSYFQTLKLNFNSATVIFSTMVWMASWQLNFNYFFSFQHFRMPDNVIWKCSRYNQSNLSCAAWKRLIFNSAFFPFFFILLSPELC